MKQHGLLAFILVIVVLTGCTGPDQIFLPTQTEEATVIPSMTTAIEITESLTPTVVFTPTLLLASETPTETLAPTPIPTTSPLPISSTNARQLVFAGRQGGGAMKTVALSPDASTVVVLTTTRLMAYNVSTGNLAWQVPTGRIFQKAVYSTDGAQIITSSRAGSVQHWNAANGERIGNPLPIIPNTRDVFLAGSGAVLTALDNFDQTFVWDTTTGQQLQFNNGFAFPLGTMNVAASPNGKIFLNTGIDSQKNFQIRLWDIQSGRFLTGLHGLPGPVFNLNFSPESLYVAAIGTRVTGGLRGLQYLYLWRVADGALLDTVDLSLDVSTYAFLGDGSTLLAGNAAGQVMVIRFSFGEKYSYGFIQDQIFAHQSPIIGLSSSGDGRQFASAASDGSIKVWDVSTGEELLSVQVDDLSLQNIHDEWIYQDLEVTNRQHHTGMSISPSGDLIARTGDDLRSIDLFDLSSGEVIHHLSIETSGYYTSPVFSPDGKTVAAALDPSKIIFWDVETGLDVLRLTTPHVNPINMLQYSPKGSQIASLGEGELFVWDISTLKRAYTLTAFHTFSYSPDGTLILTDSQESGVNILDALSGQKLVWIDTGKTNQLAVSPDSNFAAVAGFRSPVRYQQENTVNFLDLGSNTLIQTLELSGYPAEVMNVAYSPDGSLVVSIDLYGDIYVWGTNNGVLLKRFEEQVEMPAQILFTPDARSLVILGNDNSIQYYQVMN